LFTVILQHNDYSSDPLVRIQRQFDAESFFESLSDSSYSSDFIEENNFENSCPDKLENWKEKGKDFEFAIETNGKTKVRYCFSTSTATPKKLEFSLQVKPENNMEIICSAPNLEAIGMLVEVKKSEEFRKGNHCRENEIGLSSDKELCRFGNLCVDMSTNSRRCACVHGYTGDWCERFPYKKR